MVDFHNILCYHESMSFNISVSEIMNLDSDHLNDLQHEIGEVGRCLQENPFAEPTEVAKKYNRHRENRDRLLGFRSMIFSENGATANILHPSFGPMLLQTEPKNNAIWSVTDLSKTVGVTASDAVQLVAPIIGGSETNKLLDSAEVSTKDILLAAQTDLDDLVAERVVHRQSETIYAMGASCVRKLCLLEFDGVNKRGRVGMSAYYDVVEGPLTMTKVFTDNKQEQSLYQVTLSSEAGGVSQDTMRKLVKHESQEPGEQFDHMWQTLQMFKNNYPES